MTSTALRACIADAGASGLTADAVRAIRPVLFADDVVTLGEAELLFALEAEAGRDASPQWRDLFVEAVAEIVVNRAEPVGYVSQTQADWLMSQLRATPCGPAAVAALLRVLECATKVPDALARFALNLVADRIGDRVSPSDVEALRRCLYAAAGEGFGFVTRAEAETLFAVADATANADNDPAFDELFARAVGNHLLAAGGHVPACAEDALARRSWLDERRSLGDGLATVFARCLTSVLSGDGFATATGWLDRRAAAQTLTPVMETLDEGETRWVLARIARDGALSRAEERLLAFIRDEAPALPPSLKSVLERRTA